MDTSRGSVMADIAGCADKRLFVQCDIVTNRTVDSKKTVIQDIYPSCQSRGGGEVIIITKGTLM